MPGARFKRGGGCVNRLGFGDGSNRRLPWATGGDEVPGSIGGSRRQIRRAHRLAKHSHQAQIKPGYKETGIGRQTAHAPHLANGGVPDPSANGRKTFSQNLRDFVHISFCQMPPAKVRL